MNHRLAALAGAPRYLVEGVLAAAHHGGWAWSPYDRALDAAYALAVLGSAAALPGLAARLALGRWGLVATRVGQAGLVAMGIESAVGVVHTVDALGALFGVGI